MSVLRHIFVRAKVTKALLLPHEKSTNIRTRSQPPPSITATKTDLSTNPVLRHQWSEWFPEACQAEDTAVSLAAGCGAPLDSSNSNKKGKAVWDGEDWNEGDYEGPPSKRMMANMNFSASL